MYCQHCKGKRPGTCRFCKERREQEAAMTLTTCHVCHGKCTYTETIPEMRVGSSHPNGWDMPPVRVQYPTGRTVERVFTCPQCQGIGRVDYDARRDAAYTSAVNDRAGHA